MENSRIEQRTSNYYMSRISGISTEARNQNILNPHNNIKEMPMNSNERDNNYMLLSIQLKQMNEVIQNLLLHKELDKNKFDLMHNNMLIMNQKNKLLETQVLYLNREISKNKLLEIHMNKEILNLKQQVNDLRKFDNNIIIKIDGIQNAMESLKVETDEKIKTEIKNCNNQKDFLYKELEAIKKDINQKNEINIKRMANLENEIYILKKKVFELQSLIIGRKLIKIILKIILNYCFKGYTQNKTEIIVNEFYNLKYSDFSGIANRLIKTILPKNKIIHMNNEINILFQDIISQRSTYGDILLLMKNSIIESDYNRIYGLLAEKNLLNKICLEEIIGQDEDLKDILDNMANTLINS